MTMSVPPETGDVSQEVGEVSSAAGEVPPITYAPPVSTVSPTPPALLRAMQPAGALFALGWAMAGLFDPRRRASVAQRQPAFDGSVQLPLVADLDPVPKLKFYIAELTELTSY
jgi:hypothetical protein